MILEAAQALIAGTLVMAAAFFFVGAAVVSVGRLKRGDYSPLWLAAFVLLLWAVGRTALGP